jgi:hypothetical protein
MRLFEPGLGPPTNKPDRRECRQYRYDRIRNNQQGGHTSPLSMNLVASALSGWMGEG